MGFFNVLGRFNEKRERKKATAAGISQADYDKYQVEKKKRLFRTEQRLKREREEKALKEKYSRSKPTISSVLKQAKERKSKGRAILTGKRISSGPNLGLVRDPFEKDKENPWTSDSKDKKNPWLD